MKIQNGNLTGAQAAETSRAQETALHSSQKVNPWAKTEHGDSVQISGLAARIAKLSAAESTGSSPRVAQLAAQYARGEYNPSPAATSRALVSDALSVDKGGHA